MIAGSILIADDDQAVLGALSRLLEHEGLAVTTARNAGDAIALAARHDFDLLLADIHMPGNTSLELLKWEPIRSGRLPTILMTGQPSLDTAIKAVGRAVEYITKPLDPAAVLSCIERVLANSKVDNAMQRSGEAAELVRTLLGISQDAASAEKKPANELQHPQTFPGLTEDERNALSTREREVIVEFIRTGSIGDAAANLFISAHTVRNHLRSTFKKLGVGSQLDLVRKVMGIGDIG